MRILAITNQYPRPGHETIAAFNRQQFRALAADHDVRVIAPVAWTEYLKDLRRGTVAPRNYVNADGIRTCHPRYYFPPRLLEHRWGQFYMRSIRKTVRAVVDEFRPDVFLACWAHPDGWAAVQLARQAGLPVVIKVIGSDVLVAAQKPRRRARIAEALREADAVVAVSHDLADHVTRLGVDRRHVQVIYEGVDETLFSPGDQTEARIRLGLPVREKILLFVANLLLSKGAAVLVEACKELRDRGFSFHCCLVGHGRDEGKIRSLIRHHGLADRVTLRGARPHAELPDWYRACDVVVLPSFSEGIPNVLREAMACGRPFVASRVGGIPEIAHESCGRLVAPGNISEVVTAVAALLRTDLRVDRAHVRERNLTWVESAELLARCLRGTLSAPSPDALVTRPCASAGGPTAPAHPTASDAAPRHPLRVLAITNQYPRLGRDGIAPFNRQQFRSLARRHDLRVVAPVAWTEHLKDLANLDPRPRTYRNRDGIWVDHPCYYYPPKALQHRYGEFYLASIRKTVERLLEQFRPDVFLACWAHPDGWAAVRLAREFGLPVLVKVHGSDLLVAGQEPRRRARIAEALCAADAVVAVSKDLADHVVRLGVDPGNVHVVYNGVDAALFSPGDRGGARARLGLPADAKMLLFVGNLLLSKGAGVLVEACKRLQDQPFDFRCYLVGQGRDKAGVRSLIARLGLRGRVILAGGCSQADLPHWYRACDLVVLPSFSEGVPNVLREALMCCRPFVATRVGGIPEIADPEFSRLVAPDNAAGLAQAVLDMLARAPSLDEETMRRNHRSWDDSAALLAHHLQAIVAAHRPQTGPPAYDGRPENRLVASVDGRA